MSFAELINNIKLLVYDCDGVLTDNRVLVDETGKESAFFNRSDGYAIGQFRKLGIDQIVISTESNPIVEKRCKKLKINVIYNAEDKRATLIDYCRKTNIPIDAVMYIGNDVNDYDAMSIVGIKGCPADAEPEIISICDWVSSKNGGYGVIRELYRIISNQLEE